MSSHQNRPQNGNNTLLRQAPAIIHEHGFLRIQTGGFPPNVHIDPSGPITLFLAETELWLEKNSYGWEEFLHKLGYTPESTADFSLTRMYSRVMEEQLFDPSNPLMIRMEVVKRLVKQVPLSTFAYTHNMLGRS